MSEPYVRHVQLLGFEKRFSPSQHYVYMFMVKWQDLTEKLVYRKYTDIYEFHVVDTVLKTEIKISFSAIPRHGGLGEELRSYRELTLTSSAQQHAGEKELKEKFPIESGDIKKEHRTIPHLPAPKWFDGLRSTENRQVTLADYCSSLLNLPPKISRCPHVLNFFKVRPDDVNPTASSNGRKPETFLLKTDNTKKNVSDITGPIILQSYRAIADYAKNTKTELSVKAGDVVDVVEKNENGWWFCQMTNKRGWVPGAYLEPLDSPDESEEQDPNYEGELHVTTQDYSGELEDELSIQQGETVEVIHKLLDGWWVVRRGSKNGYFPAMYLQKSGDAPVAGNKTKNLPPRRRTISNANSIHTQKRKEISQETYRRNSKKYLKQRQSTIDAVKSLTIEEQNENENKAKAQPAIPPRPSKELILDKCSEHTKNKIQTVN